MIKFDKVNHQYENGRLKSVSSWISQFVPPFDKDKIAGFVAKKEGKHVSEILDKWEQKKDIALHLGNWVHESIEYYLKFDREFENVPVSHFKEHQSQNRYLSEIVVHDEELAGTIDLIEVVGEKEVVLHDFKTNESLTKKNGKLLGKFKDLDNTPLNKYRLQLSKYKQLLEGMTDYKVVGLNIWHYKPGKGFEIINIEEIKID
jgi:hypothetical protein